MKLLIVEDDRLLLTSLQSYAEDIFEEVYGAVTLEEARKLALVHSPHVILLDDRLPDGNGIDSIPLLKEIDPIAEIIVMTAYGDSKTIVDAIKSGAFHYIAKPFEVTEVLNLLKKAAKQVKLNLDRFANRDFEFEIIGNSDAIKKVKNLIEKVKDFDIPILITGETGTGKELVAKQIHFKSKRRSNPFVDVNCSAIPSELFESEVFGYEKGAFTGADKRKIGLMEEASEGTLFLDEIGDMPLPMQAKLLRVLEERKFRRLGGVKDIPFKARVIAATNKQLKKEIKKGLFRDDLYFRINVITIEIPPLRERKEDIPYLVEYFVDLYARKYRKKIKRISPELLKRFEEYSWPGNVRELRNLIERAVILSEGEEIKCNELFVFPSSQEEEKHYSSVMSLKEVEKKHIKYILEYTGWNKSRAAKILGITRTTLRNKIREYNLE